MATSRALVGNNPINFVDPLGLAKAGSGSGGGAAQGVQFAGPGAPPASRGDQLLANPTDRNVVVLAVSRARFDVARRNQFSGINVTSGAVVRGQPGGNLKVGQVGTSIVSGLEEGSNCFAGCLRPIRGAQAIGVSLPVFAREGSIRGRAGDFIGLSNQLGGVPVFVVAPKDGAIILFEAGFEPRSVSFR